MKKVLTLLLMVLTLLVVFVSCDEPKHEHSFGTEWKYDENTHWHEATCGHTDVKGDEAKHDWDEGTQTTDPGYGTPGVKTYTCKVCGKTKEEPISPLDAKDNTVTYGGSTSKDYDGNAVALESDKITRSGDGAITFMYKKSTEEDSAYTSAAPKDAGTYSVKISVAATAEWKATEEVVEYVINKIVLPVQTLNMTYEVLKEDTLPGYKSKLFTSDNGLPEGVLINVFPYNKAENGTFTVASSGSTTYSISAGSDGDSALQSELATASSTLEPNQFLARIDLGPNYTLPEDRTIATLKLEPKEITGIITGSKDYDGKAYLEIMGTDLVENGVYEEDKNGIKLLLNVKDANAGSNKTVINATTRYTSNNEMYYNYIIRINNDDVSFKLTINKKKLTVPELYGPVLKDASGTVIDSRVVEIGTQYGAVEKFTITLRSSLFDWGLEGRSAHFYSKTEKPEKTEYYEMDEKYSKNYYLEDVFFNVSKTVANATALTLGSEYTASAIGGVLRKFTATAGTTYKVDITEGATSIWCDPTGRILAPDVNGCITPTTTGEIYLFFKTIYYGKPESYTYKVYQVPVV